MADDRDGQGERWLVHLASLGLLAARPPEVCSTRRLSTLTANELPAGGRAMKVDVVSLLRQHGSEPFFLQRDQRCAVLSHDLREAIIRRPLAWATLTVTGGLKTAEMRLRAQSTGRSIGSWSRWWSGDRGGGLEPGRPQARPVGT